MSIQRTVRTLSTPRASGKPVITAMGTDASLPLGRGTSAYSVLIDQAMGIGKLREKYTATSRSCGRPMSARSTDTVTLFC